MKQGILGFIAGIILVAGGICIWLLVDDRENIVAEITTSGFQSGWDAGWADAEELYGPYPLSGKPGQDYTDFIRYAINWLEPRIPTDRAIVDLNVTCTQGHEAWNGETWFNCYVPTVFDIRDGIAPIYNVDIILDIYGGIVEESTSAHKFNAANWENDDQAILGYYD